MKEVRPWSATPGSRYSADVEAGREQLGAHVVVVGEQVEARRSPTRR